MKKHLNQLLKPLTFGLCIKKQLGLASINDAKSVITYYMIFFRALLLHLRQETLI